MQTGDDIARCTHASIRGILLLAGAATSLTMIAARPAQGQGTFLQDGQAGFIVTNIRYGFTDNADVSGAWRPARQFGSLSPI